ncbi:MULTISPECIES: Na+/H+ antiporter subunit E [unclassified Modestobacter]
MSAVGRTLRHAGRLVSFAVSYAGRFLLANFEVAREIVTPGIGVTPAVIRLELGGRTDLEVASFIALIGLTPGTMVIASHDRRAEGGTVDVAAHVMHVSDVAETRDELYRLEDRMLAAWRRSGEPSGRSTGRAAGKPAAPEREEG